MRMTVLVLALLVAACSDDEGSNTIIQVNPFEPVQQPENAPSDDTQQPVNDDQAPTNPQPQPQPGPCLDTDGDGFGWNGVESCDPPQAEPVPVQPSPEPVQPQPEPEPVVPVQPSLIDFTLGQPYRCWSYDAPSDFWIWEFSQSGQLLDPFTEVIGNWSQIDGASYYIDQGTPPEVILTRSENALTLSNQNTLRPWGSCWIATDSEVVQFIESLQPDLAVYDCKANNAEIFSQLEFYSDGTTGNGTQWVIDADGFLIANGEQWVVTQDGQQLEAFSAFGRNCQLTEGNPVF